MLTVCISHRNYTHKPIKETGEFVIVFPNEEMVDLIKSNIQVHAQEEHIDKIASAP
ncbi:hypothetical protein DRO35_04425 [Candidatus Bathyarchaeota archaeon]|nr:MAG: hypothetical protein DRO35_04425 [Candidatus Bathyarchaeota archaeon]